MPAKFLKEPEKGANRGRRNQERHAKTERVDGEQSRSFGDVLLARRERKDHRQNRADTGCPAECKGESDDIGADETGHPVALVVIAQFAVEEGHVEQSKEVQPHDDDDDACDLAEEIEMGPEQLARRRGTGAEQHEDGRETEHEQKGGGHRPRLRSLFPQGEIIERRASNEAQIRRHQGQHARAQETQGSGDQCGENRYGQFRGAFVDWSGGQNGGLGSTAQLTKGRTRSILIDSRDLTGML